MNPAAGRALRVAVLYTSVEESLAGVEGKMRESMDLAVSARAVMQVLRGSGHAADCIGFGKDVLALGQALRAHAPDAVFNLSECPMNSAQKEPHGAAFLELLGIPYTGNGPFPLSACNDKALAKRILAAHGIATPAFRLYDAAPAGPCGLPFPAIVKPAREDGSAGITEDSVVDGEDALRERVADVVARYRQEAIVEEYVGGREFNVAVLGNGTREDPHRILPPAELVYRNPKWRVCSFESKWDPDHPAYTEIAPQCPAAVDDALRGRLEATTLRCARAFSLCGYARVDYREDLQGNLHVIEVNPNPDISPDAGLARAGRAVGMDYGALVLEILRLGVARGPR